VSLGMSLVISSGFGFDRITCVYAGLEKRKSTESSSKSSRKLPLFAPEAVAINAGMIEHRNVGPEFLLYAHFTRSTKSDNRHASRIEITVNSKKRLNDVRDFEYPIQLPAVLMPTHAPMTT
jgi:hypothetical protein